MDPETPLDPEAAHVIDRVEREGFPGWSSMTVADARRLEDELFSGDGTPALPLVEDLTIDGPGGPLDLRWYRPRPDEERPTIVHYHGGGWVLGTLDSVDGICRDLAHRTGCVVVSVDYRLAPEHPFPAAVDDAWATLQWVGKHGSTLGGDGRLVVSGTSAGGTLATATALRSGAFDGPDVDHQLLLYPVTDHAPDDTGPDCSWLTRTDMEWFSDHYLRSPVDGANPYAVPMRAPDSLLARTPTATVVTAGHDPLGPEGRAYADRLQAAGVEVTHHHYADQPHGFLSLTGDVTRADEAMDTVAETIREAFEADR